MFNSCMYINLEILHKVYSESVACFETHAHSTTGLAPAPDVTGSQSKVKQRRFWTLAVARVISQVSYYRSVLNL